MFRKILLLALVLASLDALSQTSSSQYHPDYVWDRTGGQGKLWLSWSPERRLGFTEGYIWAYQRGFSDACVAYFDASPPPKMTLDLADSPLQKCKLREPSYSKVHGYYEAAVTAYYEKYHSNVDLPIPWLFLAFSDSENKGPEEIHRAWSKHEHP